MISTKNKRQSCLHHFVKCFLTLENVFVLLSANNRQPIDMAIFENIWNQILLIEDNYNAN